MSLVNILPILLLLEIIGLLFFSLVMKNVGVTETDYWHFVLWTNGTLLIGAVVWFYMNWKINTKPVK